MKVKFYLLPIMLFLFVRSGAQDCSTLSFSYTAYESRCVATGSIAVNVAGGSGNYNYKAIGPVTTPTTSSNLITGLPTGYYKIIVKDLTSGCTRQLDSAFVPGTYSDPRFRLEKTDATCAGNDGTISVIGQQFGRSPFSYTIVTPSPSSIGATSVSGDFTGLTPGEYSIRLQDSCGGIQVRRITIENYSWWFDSTSVVRFGCDSVQIYIRLKDNKGHINLAGTAFNGFNYGYTVNPGDTVWTSAFSFNAALNHHRSLTIVVKDNCGNLHTTAWSLPDSVKPSLNAVATSNLNCTSFTATVAGQNLTNPQYCLLDNASTLITCNTTGTFTHIAYGSYCITVTDACYDTTITRCFTITRPAPSVDPSVAISNLSCTGFTATITGQQNLVSANYCLNDSDGVSLTCNATGVFTNIPYGSYCITIKDGCRDTIIKRCFTVLKPKPLLTGYNLNSSCTSVNVTVFGSNLFNPNYCLYDSVGNIITCDSSGVFNGLNHGHYCVRAISCGDTSNAICFTSSRPIPSLGNGISILNRKCSTFGVGVWGQSNLVDASYCLYTTTDSLVTCSPTGQFDNIPYGSYCIKVRDGCYDTTITRCFTELGIPPAVNATMQLLGSDCSTVSFQATGTHLTNPQFCLYNAADSLLGCNASGIFNSQAYGRYCVVVRDGCKDTSFRVCQTFAPVRGISLSTSKSCTIGNTFIDVRFPNGNAPFNIKVYHPNGSVIVNVNTYSNPYRIELTPVPVSIQYKVVGVDNCGNKDSATVIPDANVVTKSISVRAKCPSATWLNGAGDLTATCNTNYYAVIPQIIRKNGAAFTQSYSSMNGNAYTFADLEPAQYVVEYTQQSCNGTLHDTVTISPYSYPTQGQSAIYQCDNNSFSLGADVHGGVSPYTFQIIGSMPDTPSIVTSPQSGAVFNINTGTTYSLVRLRAVDACGNATLNDVSVLPLQNLSITANTTCFYQNITLLVDSVPNAIYTWYRKTSPTDSVLLGTGQSYNLPFFVPEQAGKYVCKVSVNNGCLTRLTDFTLDGNCGYQLLAAALHLNGRKSGNSNQLYWLASSERGVVKYRVERKGPQDAAFVAIGTVAVQGSRYSFLDADPVAGDNRYRIQAVYANRMEYSNEVKLNSGGIAITIYPNPVQKEVHVSISGGKTADYRIEILSATGQLIYSTTVKNTGATNFIYTRNRNLPGMYLLRITDTDAGTTETRKLVFE